MPQSTDPNNAETLANRLGKAVDAGDANAAFRLAEMYRSGENQVPRDLTRAVSLYKTAARLENHPMAMNALGILHEQGWGVKASQALAPFLTSLKSNDIVIEIANDGTAPISSVDITATNTSTELASTSTTNLENIVLIESSWDIGNIDAKSTKYLTATVYVPQGLKGDTLRIPLLISYYNAHGDKHEISKIVDFYIKGLIDLRVFNVDVIELSGIQMIIGEIINEGNADGLFGFVTVDSGKNSNIKSNTQFIDEIETDAPVPFNIPIEFDGEPRSGEHDITITVRYKDSVRDEIFLTYDTTVTVKEFSSDEDNTDSTLVIIPIVITITIGVGIYLMRRRKKIAIETNN